MVQVFRNRSRRRRFPTTIGLIRAICFLAACVMMPATTVAGGVDETTHIQSTFRPIPSFAPLVKAAKHAVVSVIVHLKPQNIAYDTAPGQEVPFFFGLPLPLPAPFQLAPPERPVPVEALGSGFFISPKGYIVTNNHVVKNAQSVQVVLWNGDKLPARIVGTDPGTDLAVLKVQRSGPFDYLRLGSSKAVHPGQWVVAIGNPFGLSETATAGIVSARGRSIGDGEYDRFIQTDAPINKGNSGGPLLNQQGEVVGVDTAILSPSGGSVGIGFAIPSNTVKRVANDLIRSGHVTRGFIGVEVQSVTPIMAQAMGLKIVNGQVHGALVAEVAAHSPAAKAGLQPGDIITVIDDRPVRSVNQLVLAIARTTPGHRIRLNYIRQGRSRQATVTVAKMPRHPNTVFQSGAAPTASHGREIGLILAPITAEARSEFQIPSSVHGALVVQVAPDSPAQEAGLQAGDVILQVNNTAILNPADASEAIHRAEARHAAALALRVMHDGQVVFVAIPLPGGQS